MVRDKLLLELTITVDQAIYICLDAEASKIHKNNLDVTSLCAIYKVALVSNFNRSQKYQRNDLRPRTSASEIMQKGNKTFSDL